MKLSNFLFLLAAVVVGTRLGSDEGTDDDWVVPESPLSGEFSDDLPGLRLRLVLRGKKKKNAGKKRGSTGGGDWGSIKLGGFKAVFPRPSLPRLLGTNNLKATSAVYPNMVYFDIPIVAQTVSVSSGAVSAYIAVTGPSFIANWSSFQDVFGQYVIVGAKFEVRVTVCSSGQGTVFVGMSDEATGSAVGSNLVFLPHIEIPIPPTLVNVPEVQRIDWICREPNDLQFYNMSSSQASTSLQFYAATATTGTGASTSATLFVTGTVRVCVRGYNA